MHTALHPVGSRPGGTAASVARVAVAGATGYTGQELLRLLSRFSLTVAQARLSASFLETGCCINSNSPLSRWSSASVTL